MNWIQKKNKIWREQMGEKKHRVRVVLGLSKPNANDNKPKDKAHRLMAEKRKVKFHPPRMAKKPAKPNPGDFGHPLFDGFLMPKKEPPKSPFESGQGFAYFLRERGFKTLGSGYYSEVLAKEGSDRVIKVGFRPDPWFDYAQWANEQGYGGGLAPKVYSFKFFSKAPKPFYVATMERLAKTVNHLPAKHDYYFLHELLRLQANNDNVMAGTLADIVVPGLGSFVEKMKGKFGKDRHFDLHGNNFMVRKDGSYVVTDPLAGDHLTKVKRWRAGALIEMRMAA